MANVFRFSIVTPEGVAADGEAELVEAASSVGRLGLMAGHQPIVADCPSGKVRVFANGKWTSYDCDAGILVMDGQQARFITAFAGSVGSVG